MDKQTIKIINVLMEAGVKVESAERSTIKCKAGCLPVAISYEMCSCHGGRMWLNQEETNIHVEISFDEYDAESGRVDPESELDWIIENMMVEKVNEFSKYIYVVKTIGQYSKDRVETRYFKSVEEASYCIFEEQGYDVFSTYTPVVKQCQNPKIRYKTWFDKDEKGHLFFNKVRVEDGEEGEPYTIEFFVYRKWR